MSEEDLDEESALMSPRHEDDANMTDELPDKNLPSSDDMQCNHAGKVVVVDVPPPTAHRCGSASEISTTKPHDVAATQFLARLRSQGTLGAIDAKQQRGATFTWSGRL